MGAVEMLLQPLQRRDVRETNPVFFVCFLVWMPRCVIPGPSVCLQDYGPCMALPGCMCHMPPTMVGSSGKMWALIHCQDSSCV